MALSRRTLILGGAVVAGGLGVRTLLAGSGPGLGSSTIEFWGGPNGDLRQAQVKAWTAKHPVKVSFKAVGATAAGVAAMRTFAAAVAAGKAPDVVDFDRFQVASYVNWHMFRPLDDFFARDKLGRARFAAPALQESVALDGKSYGLPSSLDVRLLYWNKDLFAQAGLDPERPPATWSDLRAAAGKLAARSGAAVTRLGFDSLAGQASLHPFAWQNGGGFQAPDARTATLPLPPNRDALQWLVDLAREQGDWPAVKAFRDKWSGSGAQHPFLAGQLAMEYELDGFAGETIARYRADAPFGVAPLPVRQGGDAPLTWCGGYSYVMSRTARQPDAGWELIKWLASEEAVGIAHESGLARASAAGGRYVPGMAGQPALDQQLAQKYQTGVPALDQVPQIALAQLEHARFREPSIAAAELWDGVLKAQAEAISLTKSPQQALEDNNAIVQRALEQAWVFVNAPGAGAGGAPR